jgi:hypothetical protein
MPGQLYNNNCQYTLISTIGTTTVDAGATPADPGYAGRWGVFYGYTATSTGAAGMVVTALDIQQVATSTGTVTNTNTIMSGTATAVGQTLTAGIAGIGVRYKGSLVIVTTGTAGAGLSLWD